MTGDQDNFEGFLSQKYVTLGQDHIRMGFGPVQAKEPVQVSALPFQLFSFSAFQLFPFDFCLLPSAFTPR